MKMRLTIERLQRRLRGERLEGDEGFSLAELIVVVAILLILVGVAVPVYLNQQKTARTNAALTELRSAKTAVAAYVSESGNTPPSAFTPGTDPGDALIAAGVALGSTEDNAALRELTITQIGTGDPLDYTFAGKSQNGEDCTATMLKVPTCG